MASVNNTAVHAEAGRPTKRITGRIATILRFTRVANGLMSADSYNRIMLTMHTRRYPAVWMNRARAMNAAIFAEVQIPDQPVNRQGQFNINDERGYIDGHRRVRRPSRRASENAANFAAVQLPDRPVHRQGQFNINNERGYINGHRRIRRPSRRALDNAADRPAVQQPDPPVQRITGREATFLRFFRDASGVLRVSSHKKTMLTLHARRNA